MVNQITFTIVFIWPSCMDPNPSIPFNTWGPTHEIIFKWEVHGNMVRIQDHLLWYHDKLPLVTLVGWGEFNSLTIILIIICFSSKKLLTMIWLSCRQIIVQTRRLYILNPPNSWNNCLLHLILHQEKSLDEYLYPIINQQKPELLRIPQRQQQSKDH